VETPLRRPACDDRVRTLRTELHGGPSEGDSGHKSSAVAGVDQHEYLLRAKRAEWDESLSICALKRFAYDAGTNGGQPGPVNTLNVSAELVPPTFRSSTGPGIETRGEKVAIVGAGPAGLTAAYELRRHGYQVTVFDALPVAGGMLAVGIPATLILYGILFLTGTTITASLRSIGGLLIFSLILNPAAAAYQLTYNMIRIGTAASVTANQKFASC